MASETLTLWALAIRALLGPEVGESGDEILLQGFFFWYRICNGRTFETPSRISFAVASDPFVVPIDCWIVFS